LSPRNGSNRCRVADALLQRELSWLAFNERVLEEAYNTAHRCWSGCAPLHLRQHLDEFYMSASPA